MAATGSELKIIQQRGNRCRSAFGSTIHAAPEGCIIALGVYDVVVTSAHPVCVVVAVVMLASACARSATRAEKQEHDEEPLGSVGSHRVLHPVILPELSMVNVVLRLCDRVFAVGTVEVHLVFAWVPYMSVLQVVFTLPCVVVCQERVQV